MGVRQSSAHIRMGSALDKGPFHSFNSASSYHFLNVHSSVINGNVTNGNVSATIRSKRAFCIKTVEKEARQERHFMPKNRSGSDASRALLFL